MDNEFRKEKLNNGCIVQTRNGEEFIFLKNANNGKDKDDMFISLSDFTWILLDEYSFDLKCIELKSLDIIKICDNEYVGANLALHSGKKVIKPISEYKKWTAVREENKEELDEVLEEINTKREIKMSKKINIEIKEHGSVLRTEGMIGFNDYSVSFQLLLNCFLKRIESARDRQFLNKFFKDLISETLEDIEEDINMFS